MCNKTIKLSEIAKVYDGPHATPTKILEGPIYFGLDAMNERGEIIPSGFNFLSDEDYIKWTKRVTPTENDIVFSYEASLHRYAIIPSNFYGCLGRRVGIIRVLDNRINPKWLYYYFLSPGWRCLIENNIVRGSTVNRISVDKLPSYEIPLISMDEQLKLVNVADSFTNKIEHNKKTVKTIEHYLDNLFESVFLRKDNSLIDVEITDDDFQKGYFNDLIHFERGGDWGDAEETSTHNFMVKCIRGADFPALNNTIEPNIPTRFISYKNKEKCLNAGDILIEISGNPGRIVYITNIAFSRFGEHIISSNFCKAIVLKDKDYSQYFYLLWKNLYKAGLCDRYTGKTTIGNLLFNSLVEQHQIEIPSKKVIKAFNKKIDGLFIKLQQCLYENDLLFEERNLIISRLTRY